MRHDKKKANFVEMRGDGDIGGLGQGEERWRRKCIFLEPILAVDGIP
jgi:hypothetical protein